MKSRLASSRRLAVLLAVAVSAGGVWQAVAHPAAGAGRDSAPGRPPLQAINPPAADAVAEQKVYPAREAGKHIGETATVRGRVAEVFVSPKGTVFVNFEKAFPETGFYAVCFGGAIPIEELKKLEGKTISVTGLIAEYFGRAQIILRDRGQLSE